MRWIDTSIDCLKNYAGLSDELINNLVTAGIFTVGNLRKYNNKELVSLCNITNDELVAIKEAVVKMCKDMFDATIMENEIPIELLPLKTRTYNILKDNLLDTVKDVESKTDKELLKLNEFGADCLDDWKANKGKIRTSLDIIGFDFGKDIHLPITQCLYTNTIYKPYYLQFKNSHGEFVNDLPVNDSSLSVRAVNVFRRHGYDTVKSIMNTPFIAIRDTTGLGISVLKDFVIKADAMCEVHYYEDELNTPGKPYQNIINDISEAICRDMNVVPNIIEQRAVRDAVVRNNEIIMSKINDHKTVSSILGDNEIMEKIYADENVLSAFNDIVAEVLKQYEDGTDYDTLKSRLPSGFRCMDNADGLLSERLGKEDIEFRRGNYIYKFESVVECVKKDTKLKAKKKEIVLDRLSGMTLEEVGQKNGLTRERIRQIVKTTLNRYQRVYERRFRYWYEKYSMNKREFCTMFDTDGCVYEYLNAMFRRGAADMKDIPEDKFFSDYEVPGFEKHKNRNKIEVYGELVNCNRFSVVEVFMKNNFSELPCGSDVIFKAYKQFYEENNLADSGIPMTPNRRAFEARLNDNRYTLMSYGRKTRYYDMDSYDIKALIDAIDFSKYYNLIVSAWKFYDAYPELMEQYNLKSEYELHNFLRKNENLLPKDVRCVRMPLIEIGKVDRRQQIRALLLENMPISKDDFINLEYETFGIDKGTFASNWLDYISEYLRGDLYAFDNAKIEIPEDHLENLKANLTEDFYFIDEIEKVYANLYPNDPPLVVTTKLVKELGFVMRSDYVFSNKYASATDCVKKTIIEPNSVIDLANCSSRFRNNKTSLKIFSDLCKDYEIYEFERNKFIKASTVDKLDKKKIDDFIKAVDENASGYFNIYSLRKNGFSHPIEKLGFSDWFYECLIRDHMPNVYQVNFGTAHLFCKDKLQGVTDIMKDVLAETKKMTRNEFVDYIKDKYGITLNKYKMAYYAQEANLDYDDATKTISLPE